MVMVMDDAFMFRSVVATEIVGHLSAVYESRGGVIFDDCVKIGVASMVGSTRGA